MKTFVFDVMLNGRFVCTLKYKYCALFPIDFDELSKIEDKTMEVNFPYSHGTQENGQPLNVDSVSVFDDCVVIY